MKSLFCFILAGMLLTTSSLYNMYEEKWNVNETKKLEEIAITRVAGENSEIGVTNITYETQRQLYHELKELKSSGKLSKDRYDIYMEKYRRNAGGGRVHVFLTRNEFDSGNMDHFNIKIYDKRGKEVFQRQYDNQIPKTNRDDPTFMWKNEGIMMVTAETFLPITIEITDNFNKATKHSFLVEME